MPDTDSSAETPPVNSPAVPPGQPAAAAVSVRAADDSAAGSPVRAADNPAGHAAASAALQPQSEGVGQGRAPGGEGDAAGAAEPADTADTADTAASGGTASDATPGAAPPVPPAADAVRSPQECADRLAALFPALFGAEAADRPIMLRVQTDIQARAPGVFSRKLLSVVLSRYTTTNAYLKALLQASTRFDLDGNPVGEITEEHRQAAVLEVARRRELRESRMAQMRAEQRAKPRAERGPRQRGAPQGPVAPVDGASDAQGLQAAGAEPAAAVAAVGAGDGAPQAAAGAAAKSPLGPRAPRSAPAVRGNRGDRPDGRGPRGAEHSRPPAPRGSDRRPATAGSNVGSQDRGPRRQGPSLQDQPSRQAWAETGASGAAADPQRANPPELEMSPDQRERANLLRLFESSPLTKSNFCALKGLRESDFDSQMEQARAERQKRGGSPKDPASKPPQQRQQGPSGFGGEGRGRR